MLHLITITHLNLVIMRTFATFGQAPESWLKIGDIAEIPDFL